MINQMNISPLPFYRRLADQYRSLSYACGNTYRLITYKNTLTPFQFVVGDSSAKLIRVILVDLSYNVRTDITASLVQRGLKVKTFGDISILKYPAKKSVDEITHEGDYYLEIVVTTASAGTSTYYSDVFTSMNNVDDCLQITYSCQENLVATNCVIDFSDSFVFNIFLQAQLGRPQYTFEEEGTDRLGYTFIETQVSKKAYSFTFVAPEYLCDALRIVRMCDSKVIINKGRSYEPINFSLSVEWLDQGDLASVTADFETDNVIYNVGGNLLL